MFWPPVRAVSRHESQKITHAGGQRREFSQKNIALIHGGGPRTELSVEFPGFSRALRLNHRHVIPKCTDICASTNPVNSMASLPQLRPNDRCLTIDASWPLQ